MSARAYDPWKRAADLVAALVLLVALSPLILLTALAVRIRIGSPVVWTQQRPGRNAVPFILYKFRSMSDARGSDGELLPDDQRLGRFGSTLRRLSLDELPQLWNVIRGDMSLIGPRPLLMRYLPRYNPTQARRHEVRPGITGWAQVHGRNAMSWNDKFAHDVWYVDHRSPWLDLRILVLTALALVSRRGVEKPGFATTDEFMGDGAGGSQ